MSNDKFWDEHSNKLSGEIAQKRIAELEQKIERLEGICEAEAKQSSERLADLCKANVKNNSQQQKIAELEAKLTEVEKILRTDRVWPITNSLKAINGE